MDLNNGKSAVNLLLMTYNLILAGLWSLRGQEESVTPFMVFLHVGLAFLLLQLPRTGEGTRWPWRVLDHLFPYVLWTLAWSEIGWFYGLTMPMVYDGAVRVADLAMLGVHLNERLSTLLPYAWLRNLMGLSYLSYYLLILGPPAVLAIRRREKELTHHTLAFMATYLACFVVYLVLPVLGPRDFAHAAGLTAPGVGGWFGPVIDAFFEAGDSLGTAFPSSHCAGSVAAALLVGRHFGKAAGRLALVWAALIVLSTIYTNNHYAIDAVAGVALAVLINRLVFLSLRRQGAQAARSDHGPAAVGMNLVRPARPARKGELS